MLVVLHKNWTFIGFAFWSTTHADVNSSRNPANGTSVVKRVMRLFDPLLPPPPPGYCCWMIFVFCAWRVNFYRTCLLIYSHTNSAVEGAWRQQFELTLQQFAYLPYNALFGLWWKDMIEISSAKYFWSDYISIFNHLGKNPSCGNSFLLVQGNTAYIKIFSGGPGPQTLPLLDLHQVFWCWCAVKLI